MSVVVSGDSMEILLLFGEWYATYSILPMYVVMG